MKGIDVAKWNLQKDKNGNLISLDWKKIKSDGVEFAIIKAINKSCVKEDAFDLNYSGAREQNIPVDVYNYSYALTTEKAKSDANAVLSVIRGKDVGRVWLDIEEEAQQTLGGELINIISEYRKVIEEAGFGFGVYTGLSFYNSFIKPYHSFLDCEFWIARYPKSAEMRLEENPDEDKKPDIANKLLGWQYTSKGRVDGIAGNVDLSIRYLDDIVQKEKPRQTLKYGDKCADVKYLQTRLTAKGYGVGAIDGVFGRKTLEAVKAFQAENGLTVDGIVGKNTWAALENKEVVENVREYSLAKDGETKISGNFKVKEFKCKDGSDKILIDVNFVQTKLQAIRDFFGAPVTINSAYRTESYNKKVGGTKSSYHMKGRAFDIVVAGHTPKEVAQCAQKLGINGIIQYNTFVHVDSRTSKYWARNDNGNVTM